MKHGDIISRVRAYYTGKINEHGATPRGVDWNSDAAQFTRFEQILSVADRKEPFRINDFGCGYGRLFERLCGDAQLIEYVGYDISPAMIAAARERYVDWPRVRFVDELYGVPVADYTVASGIFSVKGEASADNWRAYVLSTIDLLRSRSSRGFAFNMLTSYSDTDRMRPDLYYADPHEMFDYCRKRFSRNVALLHDYGIFEFTIRVRLD
jgi:SAM-dependent methyltransferase